VLSPGDVIIRDLRSSDVPAAVDRLADAFLDFPAMHMFAGSDDGARDRLRRMFAMEFEPAARITVIVAEAEGRLAGALTYVDSPSCSAMSAGRALRFMRIAGPRIVRAMRMFGRIERVHPKAPHRHLPTIGVSPRLQSQGVGQRLMEAFGDRCDAAGRMAYLETIRWADSAKPSHERFYGRLGYAVSDIIPMTEDWSVLTMSRTAASAATGEARTTVRS
jgi:ribosomal protein S18 acetylase RimI-like enzyme